ncbi:hypothetical protein K1T71_005519 [Dendrolimus kikuchii]|uniref:Uncharacterized protein n=1 Tax=Dendrolimus kikuchii TaxID=765133 RepID=A0ACC1D484_9NEOP|nr:hypothetical protein K1T71_005519 [Dendrolimus kikuchii]
MFTLYSQRLRRRLSAPTSGSLRRRARERLLAEKTRLEGERLAKERREKRAREKLECQRKAHEELASYEPWGKAGGGAPNPRGFRFTNLRDKGIFPEDELKGISLFEACRRWASSPHRRQRRTPLRLREDPQLCYAENLRQSVDNDIRYKQTPTQQLEYKQILDDMVDKRKKAIRDEKKRNLEYERKMHTMAGPWGKPGPGGTTWRNPRNVGLNFSNSMGWTDDDIFNKLKGDHRRYKRSSLTLPQVKRDDDSAERSPEKENIRPSSIQRLPDIDTNRYKCNETGNERKMTFDDEVNVNIEVRGKKRSPRKKKLRKRSSNGEKVRRILPDEDNYIFKENGINNCVEKKPTPEATILRLTGGVELVPLLARRRRVGARTLPSSDVTRPPEQPCQWRQMLDLEYLGELKHQMRVKCEQKEERRRDSAESVRQHHATWESLWGRPGHGAPQLRGRYARNNLAQLLYVTPLNNAQ